LDLCSSSFFPLRSVIALTFFFGFNAWKEKFLLTCASNFPILEVNYPIFFSKLLIPSLVFCWKDMKFCCKVIVLEAEVFIISWRSSLDDLITLEFVNAGGCLAW
jgi:hypothetical protein